MRVVQLRRRKQGREAGTGRRHAVWLAATLLVAACGGGSDGQAGGGAGGHDGSAGLREAAPRADWSGGLAAARLLADCLDDPANADTSFCFDQLTGAYQDYQLGAAGEHIVDRYEAMCGAVTTEDFYYPACADDLNELAALLRAEYGLGLPSTLDEPPESSPALVEIEPDLDQLSSLLDSPWREVEPERRFGHHVLGVPCDGLRFDDGYDEVRAGDRPYRADAVGAREVQAPDGTRLRTVVAVFATESDAELVAEEVVTGWEDCWGEDGGEVGVSLLTPASSDVLDSLHRASRTSVGVGPATSEVLGQVGPVVVWANFRDEAALEDPAGGYAALVARAVVAIA